MFGCEYCHRLSGHAFCCPNYEPTTSRHNCYKCGENILIGEKYIVNDDGNYVHWECVDYAKDLAKFLGYEIKEMEDEDE